jgi:hypothetical protein
VGLFVIGLGWVIWFVERASRRFAKQRMAAKAAVPIVAVAAPQGGAPAHPPVSLFRLKLGLVVVSGLLLCGAAFLPFVDLESLIPESLSFGLAFLPRLVLIGVSIASIALALMGKNRALWLPAVCGALLLVWVAVDVSSKVHHAAADAGGDVSPIAYVLAVLASGFWVAVLGSLILMLAAAVPSAVEPDASGRLMWHPLDAEAWYYGRSSKKLNQSLAAFLAYALCFLIALWLVGLIGGSERFEMPAGGGGGRKAQLVQQVKIQKVIKKKFIVNPFSSIIFNPPPIDEVKLRLTEMTQHQYKAGQGAGQGFGFGDGDGAGFAGGTSLGKVRFIRLEYAGGDWSQDFGVGADVNMLVEYHARTSHKVAEVTESRTIALLGRAAVDAAPPFVYVTGQKDISVSKQEVRILRDYLLEKHGMIFGDNGGSGHFHNQFFQMMRQVLPNVEPVRVALDDPIHVQPYRIPFLPYVAPHGGRDAWGWKVDGRWVCYYHPGDIGDAWSDEHAGVKPEIAEYCYQLGTNVIFYAYMEYSKWLSARRQRK